jgi:hypothetical protein
MASILNDPLASVGLRGTPRTGATMKRRPFSSLGEASSSTSTAQAVPGNLRITHVNSLFEPCVTFVPPQVPDPMGNCRALCRPCAAGVVRILLVRTGHAHLLGAICRRCGRIPGWPPALG